MGAALNMTGASTIATAKIFFAALVRELRWRLLGAATISVLLALTEGAALLLLIPMLQSIGLAADDRAATGVASMVSRGFALVGLQPTLFSVVGLFLVITVARGLLELANFSLQPTLQLRFGDALRQRLYAALVRSRWSFFVTQRQSDLLHVLFREVDRASGSGYQVLALFTGLAVCGVSIAVAFRLSPLLTTLVSVVGFGALWIIRHRTNRSSELGRRHGDADRAHFRTTMESLSGLKVAKTIGAENNDLEIFRRSARERTRANLDYLRAFAKAKTGLDVGSAFLMGVLIVFAASWLDLRGTSLLVLIFIFVRTMPRVMALQNAAQLMSVGLPSFAAVVRLIDAAESHAERPAPDVAGTVIRSEVRFEGVSFAYESAVDPVVQDISLRIPAGRTTAIVGASGAGKSTFADILIGLLRPTRGTLLADGTPLSDGDIGAWRRSVGYVPQDGFLLHDTIRANFLWAVPQATEAQIWDALSRAAASDFVRSRPKGLDTVVGDRGVLLSGGERQRLALARALIANPQLLVLDEATSALDSLNEQQILETVRALTGRITTVIITHRLSAIRNADVIYVLEKGRLVESGTWPDLVHRGGAFARLLAAQGLGLPEADPVQSVSRG